MPTDQLLILIFLLIAIIAALFAGTLLLQARARQYRASRLMIWLLSAFTLAALNRWLSISLLDNGSLAFHLLLGFAAAPLLLLYLRSLLGDRLSRGRDGYHFFPFFGIALISLIPGQLDVWYNSWWATLPDLYVAAYLVASFLYIKERLPSMVEIRSRLPMGKLRMLKLCLLLWLLFLLSDGVGDVFRLLEAESEPMATVSAGLQMLLVLGLAGAALVRERPVGPADLQEEAFLYLIAGREEPEPEDIRSNASLFKTLDASMQSEKYFFDDDLRLNQLAGLMKKTPREISRAIHHVGGQSFFDYVNGYRALAAQGLIDNPDKQLSLEEIRYACGMESKLVFRTTFKRLTGSSPKAYYKLNA